MSVFSYEENGQTLWRFYLNLRSKKNPRIRVQRMQKGFLSRKEAEKDERLQFIQISSEISSLETH